MSSVNNRILPIYHYQPCKFPFAAFRSYSPREYKITVEFSAVPILDYRYFTNALLSYRKSIRMDAQHYKINQHIVNRSMIQMMASTDFSSLLISSLQSTVIFTCTLANTEWIDERLTIYENIVNSFAPSGNIHGKKCVFFKNELKQYALLNLKKTTSKQQQWP